MSAPPPRARNDASAIPVTGRSPEGVFVAEFPCSDDDDAFPALVVEPPAEVELVTADVVVVVVVVVVGGGGAKPKS